MENAHIQEFFQRLDALEPKHRIHLKRSCGMLLRESDAETMQVFFRVLPQDVPGWLEDHWFTAACIHCLWKAEEENRKPMQECIAAVKGLEETSESFEKRFTTLLETPWEEDGFLCRKMERMAKYLKQKGYAVDGAPLLRDLLYWDYEDKFVQKQWIKTYWQMTQKED